jgi:hypothetical protein
VPTTYVAAPTDARAQLDDLIAAKFPELHESGLAVELLFAVPDEGKSAFKRFGHPAEYRIESIDPKARMTNRHDVRLLIDSDWWQDKSRRRRESLLFTALTSLELRREKKTGAIVRDDADRPLVKVRPGDWLITGFDATLRAYGRDSSEWHDYSVLRERMSQLQFAWADDQAPADEMPDVAALFRPADQEAGESTRPFDR